MRTTKRQKAMAELLRLADATIGHAQWIKTDLARKRVSNKTIEELESYARQIGYDGDKMLGIMREVLGWT